MRFTIKAKLTLAFGLILTLFALAGGFSIVSLSGSNDRMQGFAAKPFAQVQRVGQLETMNVEASRLFLKTMAVPTDAERVKLQSDFFANDAQFQAVLKEYGATVPVEERGSVQALGETWAKVVALAKSGLELAVKNGKNSAIKLIETEFTPSAQAIVKAIDAVGQRADIDDSSRASATALQLTVSSARLYVNRIQVMNDDALLKKLNDDFEETIRKLDVQAPAFVEAVRKAGFEAEANAIGAALSAFEPAARKVVAIGVQNSDAKANDIFVGPFTEERLKVTAATTKLRANEGAIADGYVADTQRAYETTRMLMIAVVLGAIALGIGMALWMALSISRGLGRAVGLADAVARGDLGQTIDASSKDEVGDLVKSLNAMTSNLKATALVADSIAAGDLTVEANPQSDKDRLGLALANMIVNLRETVGVADTIARGDLAVEPKPRSDKDTLGAALRNMVVNLKATAAVADAIAAGDLTVEARPLSDKDTLGIALENMVVKLREHRRRGDHRRAEHGVGQPGTFGERRAALAGRDRTGLVDRGGLVRDGGNGLQRQAERRQRRPDRGDRPSLGGRRGSERRRGRPRGRRDADHRLEDQHRPGDRAPDRSARAQRGGRGRPRGRARPRLRGRGVRSAQARRTQPGGGGRDRHTVRRHGEGRAGGGRHAVQAGARHQAHRRTGRGDHRRLPRAGRRLGPDQPGDPAARQGDAAERGGVGGGLVHVGGTLLAGRAAAGFDLLLPDRRRGRGERRPRRPCRAPAARQGRGDGQGRRAQAQAAGRAADGKAAAGGSRRVLLRYGRRRRPTGRTPNSAARDDEARKRPLVSASDLETFCDSTRSRRSSNSQSDYPSCASRSRPNWPCRSASYSRCSRAPAMFAIDEPQRLERPHAGVRGEALRPGAARRATGDHVGRRARGCILRAMAVPTDAERLKLQGDFLAKDAEFQGVLKDYEANARRRGAVARRRSAKPGRAWSRRPRAASKWRSRTTTITTPRS